MHHKMGMNTVMNDSQIAIQCLVDGKHSVPFQLRFMKICFSVDSSVAFK